MLIEGTTGCQSQSRHGRALFLPLVPLALTLLGGCGGSGGKTTEPPANRPPVMATQADTSCVIGDTLRLLAQAFDSDDDALDYAASIKISYEEFHSGYLPAGGMNAATGAFWFAPSNRDRTSRRITFFVDDGRGGRDSTNFQVTVP